MSPGPLMIKSTYPESSTAFGWVEGKYPPHIILVYGKFFFDAFENGMACRNCGPGITVKPRYLIFACFEVTFYFFQRISLTVAINNYPFVFTFNRGRNT